MKESIYAIRVDDSRVSGLKILSVKIGRSKDPDKRLKVLQTGIPDAEMLDKWEVNSSISLLQCEKGVHKIAEKYAYRRDRERFIFSQKNYADFAENMDLLLKNLRSKKQGGPSKKLKGRKKHAGIKKLHQKAYRLPILEVLLDLGGSAKPKDVLEEVYQKVKNKLREDDNEFTSSGREERWRNTARWERQNMINDGLLKKKKGIWEISEKGRDYYKKYKNS